LIANSFRPKINMVLNMHGASGGARGALAPPTAAEPVELLVLPFQF
jgi:hypothetical protein